MIKRGIHKVRDSLVYFDRDMHPAFGIKKMLFSGESKFQKIQVAEFHGLGRGLILNGESQFFEADEQLYHSSFVDPVLRNKTAEKILIIGGGDGGVAREALKYSFVKKIKIVDIDKKVTDVVKKYFKNFANVFSNPKIELINQDALDFVNNCDESFDAIFVDLTDFEIKEGKKRQVNRFYLSDFVKNAKSLLKEDGVIVYQSCGYYTYPDAVEQLKRNFKKAFKNSLVYGVFIPSFLDLWCFAVGSDRGISIGLDSNSKMFNIFEIGDRPNQIRTL